jgi:hypothetical protein
MITSEARPVEDGRLKPDEALALLVGLRLGGDRAERRIALAR